MYYLKNRCIVPFFLRFVIDRSIVYAQRPIAYMLYVILLYLFLKIVIP